MVNDFATKEIELLVIDIDKKSLFENIHMSWNASI